MTAIVRNRCELSLTMGGIMLAPSSGDFYRHNRRGQNQGRCEMGNIFYIIGVVVVVLFILGYLGLR